jgi:tRNA nucleotidyltransferase (CCA-adding enzyme)
MAKNIASILKEVLEKVKPSKEELDEIEKLLNSYLKRVEANIKKKKINAQVFVGGSAAKKTMIKKDGYDADVFIRFDKKYKDNLLSDMTEKILENMRGVRIHGSRDYFKIKVKDNLSIEFVPVRKIGNPREAVNVTDLSYSHVTYIKKKVKSDKLLDEIRLAKAFCFANRAYGAESYVQGFSGYGLELLIYKYKSFINFIKAMVRIKPGEKEIIDIEKHYKNKNLVMTDINAAKLESPVILVDPTYKHRNVLAALSKETFLEFQKVCMEFLKNPSENFFVPKVIDLEKIKAGASNKGYEFVLLKIKTKRQPGDIAGSKLLKFYRHLSQEMERFFDIKAKGFEYDKIQTSRIFLVAEKKREIIKQGPKIEDSENANTFRKKHKQIFIKNGRLYSRMKVNFSLRSFLASWVSRNIKKIKEMSVSGFDVLD